MNTYKISRNQLSKQPIGCIVGSEGDNGKYDYKNIVISYMNGIIPILIKTNLSSEQWQLFEQGKLSKQELEKYI